MAKPCSVEGCDRPSRRWGLCHMHSMRMKTHGDPLTKAAAGKARRPVADRLWERVDKRGDCWMFSGNGNGWGYGVIGLGGRGGRQVLAHRLAYELEVGPIPAGMDIDHICHNRDKSCPGGPTCRHRMCCRPDHLRPATRSENLANSGRVGAGPSWNASKTHCLRGHEFTVENTSWWRGRRKCRTCKNERRWKAQ